MKKIKFEKSSCVCVCTLRTGNAEIFSNLKFKQLKQQTCKIATTLRSQLITPSRDLCCKLWRLENSKFFSLNFDYNYSMSVARVVSRSRNDVNSRHVDSHKSKCYNFFNNMILKHFSYYIPNNFHINIEQRKKI